MKKIIHYGLLLFLVLSCNPRSAFGSNGAVVNDDTLKYLAMCESSNREEQITLGDGYNGESAIGLFQFQQRTWDWLTKRYKLQDLDIMKGEDQKKIVIRALEESRWHLWYSCLKKKYQ